MIILSKKRILTVISMVMICVLACTIQQNQSRENNNINLEATQVVALPVSNKVVVLDARTSESQMRGRRAVLGQQKQPLI